MEDFSRVLRELQKPVWEHIQPFLKGRFPQKHYDILAEYPKRQGKYFRPALVLLGAELLGAPRERAIGVAAAVQLSEEWLLVHDDVEDHSALRRGAPSLNALWGDEIAINAGDALHILMWRVLGDAIRELDAEAGHKIFNTLNETLLVTTEGQFLELAWRHEGRAAIAEEEYMTIAERKSAGYSVVGPLTLGAILAGAAEQDFRQIELWALPFGLAFQIWDDILDLTGETSAMGKERYRDIAESKPTLVLAHCLARADVPTRDELAAIYRKTADKKTPEEIDWVLTQFRQGSIAYAKAKATALITEAKEKFAAVAVNLPGKDAARMLEEAMEFVITRTK